MNIRRKSYFSPQTIFDNAVSKLSQIAKSDERIDYFTFVPDGEPTIDVSLGTAITKLKTLGAKIAVITNASLISRPDVRRDLAAADWVSLKIDSVEHHVWKRVNRPHGSLDLQEMMEGAIVFANDFKGTLVTETMLVGGVNDALESVGRTAIFIKRLSPKKSYILVPTRPPTEPWSRGPDAKTLKVALQVFEDEIKNIELLANDEGTQFSCFENPEGELLSILAVHPMAEDAVGQFLLRYGSGSDILKRLLAARTVKAVTYAGRTFYVNNREKDRT